MINLLGAVSAGIFICGDFDNKTIHDAITCGCTRGTITVSKTTGLGLSIVKLLAEGMGGTVSASLKENQIAIQVELPLCRQ